MSRLPFASVHLCDFTLGADLLGVMMNVRSAPRLKLTIICKLEVSHQVEARDYEYDLPCSLSYLDVSQCIHAHPHSD